MTTLWRRAVRRPYLTVGAVALVTRMLFALGTFLVHEDVLIPDEQQYLELGRAVADGRGAEGWYPFYGQSLYDSVRVFIVPIRMLFDLFGPSRLVAQAWPVLFGVVTAVLTARLARRILEPPWALGVGLVVALFPSQILWSSVVLRESLVWAGMVAAALGATEAARASRRAALAWLGLCAASVLGLAYLRDQTMVIVAFALAPGMLLAARDQRAVRAVGALAVAVVVPIVAGAGPLGWDVVERSVPALGNTRANLAAGADSAFAGTTIAARPVTMSPGSSSSTSSTTADERPGVDEPPGVGEPPGVDEPPVTGATTTTTTVVLRPDEVALVAPNGTVVIVERPDIGPDQTAVVGNDGKVYVVGEETFGTSISNAPRGAVATLLRPFAWEWGDTLPLRFAALENVLWYAGYVLAAVGIVLSWRRALLVAPAAVMGAGILVVAFVSQGNVGTAFRHRAQVLPLLAALAGLGLREIVLRRLARTAATAADGDGPVSSHVT